MKIQIFSDLHLDVAATKSILIDTDVDLVLVAGDTAEGALASFRALRRIVRDRIPIAMTMGNHEYYGGFFHDDLAAARAEAPNYNIHLLENDIVILGGVRIVGATLWTNYRLFGAHNAPAAMNAARAGMNDHRRIGWRKEPWQRFRPQEALMEHTSSCAFIARTLAQHFSGPTIVITHHAPDARSVPERFSSDILSAAFASDLLDRIVGADKRCDFWIHGHTHDSFDYLVAEMGMRLIANPHGYVNENPNFNPQLTIEVNA